MIGRAIVVMGVSGVGKSSIGQGIADRIGGRYVDADDLHPAVNVAHMAAGKPLNDDMRWPWLDKCGQVLDAGRRTGDIVLACSALKRIYRDRLRDNVRDLVLVYLEADRDLIWSRMEARKNHYMPASLLDSQLATLEPPTDDENPITVRTDIPVEQIVDAVMAQLSA